MCMLGCGCGGMWWGHVGVQTRLRADQCKEKRKTYLLMWVGMWMRMVMDADECQRRKKTYLITRMVACMRGHAEGWRACVRTQMRVKEKKKRTY